MTITYLQQEENFVVGVETECPTCHTVYEAQIVDGDKRALQLRLEQAESELVKYNAVANSEQGDVLDGWIKEAAKWKAKAEQAEARAKKAEDDYAELEALDAEETQAASDIMLQLKAANARAAELEAALSAERKALDASAVAFAVIDEWLGHAGTRQTALDAMLRAVRELKARGYDPKPSRILDWRGSLIRELNEAGFYNGPDDLMHYDPAGLHVTGNATGPTLKELIHERNEARAQAAQLREVCEQFIAYRDRAGAINFQLEKADDYFRAIRAALSATPADSAAYLAALEAEYESALLLNDSMSPARELIDFDDKRFAAAVRDLRKQLAAVKAAKRGWL